MAQHDPALRLRGDKNTALFFCPAPHEPDVRCFILHRIHGYEVRRESPCTYSAHYHAGDNVWVDLITGATESAAFGAVADHIPCLPPSGVLPHFWDFERRCEKAPEGPAAGWLAS